MPEEEVAFTMWSFLDLEVIKVLQEQHPRRHRVRRGLEGVGASQQGCAGKADIEQLRQEGR